MEGQPLGRAEDGHRIGEVVEGLVVGLDVAAQGVAGLLRLGRLQRPGQGAAAGLQRQGLGDDAPGAAAAVAGGPAEAVLAHAGAGGLGGQGVDAAVQPLAAGAGLGQRRLPRLGQPGGVGPDQAAGGVHRPHRQGRGLGGMGGGRSGAGAAALDRSFRGGGQGRGRGQAQPGGPALDASLDQHPAVGPRQPRLERRSGVGQLVQPGADRAEAAQHIEQAGVGRGAHAPGDLGQGQGMGRGLRRGAGGRRGRAAGGAEEQLRRVESLAALQRLQFGQAHADIGEGDQGAARLGHGQLGRGDARLEAGEGGRPAALQPPGPGGHGHGESARARRRYPGQLCFSHLPRSAESLVYHTLSGGDCGQGRGDRYARHDRSSRRQRPRPLAG